MILICRLLNTNNTTNNNSKNSNTSLTIGIRFTREPESRVVPPGDRVFFNCRTNTGQGRTFILQCTLRENVHKLNRIWAQNALKA